MALGKNIKQQSGHKKNIPGQQHLEQNLLVKEHPEVVEPDEAWQTETHQEESALASQEGLMLVVFSVEQEEYALPIDTVSEVVKTPPIAPIPQVPDYIKGVANVRGNVVTILDLAVKVGLSQDLTRFPNHLMVIKSDEYQIALGIDQVPDTLMVKNTEIDHSSELMLHSALDEVYIKGIIKKEQRMIILIDILQMMARETFVD